MGELPLDGGKYMLVRQLWDGSGSSTPWLAKTPSGTEVTAKIFSVPFNKREADRLRGYFRDEVECGLALHGPHIRKQLAFGEVPQDRVDDSAHYPNGLLYIIFEYIEFGTLGELLEQRSLKSSELRDLIKAVSNGLAEAHSLPNPIFHRDLKPGNILLPDGSCAAAKLADFGIARQVGGTKLTTTGFGVGTDRYMAPEQFADSHSVDARADIYSFALVLWEILSGGEVPYDEGNRMDTWRAREGGRALPDLRIEGRPLLMMSHVLRQALSADPVSRPADVLAFVEALRSAGVEDHFWGDTPVVDEIQPLDGPMLDDLAFGPCLRALERHFGLPLYYCSKQEEIFFSPPDYLEYPQLAFWLTNDARVWAGILTRSVRGARRLQHALARDDSFLDKEARGIMWAFWDRSRDGLGSTPAAALQDHFAPFHAWYRMHSRLAAVKNRINAIDSQDKVGVALALPTAFGDTELAALLRADLSPLGPLMRILGALW